MSDEWTSAAGHRWVPVILTLPIAWLFLPPFLSGEFFLYRDAAHYYHPLFQHVQEQWESGLVPLWNSGENTGQPLAADVTASVFYPGKIVFWLPLSYERRFLIYVFGHYLFGLYGTYQLARRWRASAVGATFSAMSYVLSGHVIFQYSNVVYLVSAVWLPWSLMYLDALLRRGGVTRGVQWGITLGLMVLGGDPQTALHTVFVGAIGGLYYFPQKRTTSPLPIRLVRPWARLATGVAVAAGLSAVQWVPSLEWAALTNRCTPNAPRSIWEHFVNPIPTGTWGTSSDRNTSTQAKSQYRFSVAPWRWPEVFWPNFSGKSFPIYRRWIHIVPAEGQTWSPSLYVGLFPAILSYFQFVGGTRSPRHRWVRSMAICSLLASLGWYGVGWILIECARIFGWQPSIDAPAGGVYWLLSSLVPGYAMFRYPAKWWTFVTLTLSLACGWGWNLTVRNPKKVRSHLKVVLSASMVALAIVVFFQRAVSRTVSNLPPSPLWGPLDGSGAMADLRLSLLQMIVVGWMTTLTLSRLRNRTVILGLLTLTAADLCWTHAWMLPTAPASIFRQVPELVHATRSGGAPVPTTTHNLPHVVFDRGDDLYPQDWSSLSSRHRLEEVVAHDRATLSAKYNLQYSLRIARSTGSAVPGEVETLWQAADDHKNAGQLAWRRLLGVDRVVLGDKTTDQTPTWSTIDGAQPRAWIVHQAESWPPESFGARRKRVASWLVDEDRWQTTALLPESAASEAQLLSTDERPELVASVEWIAHRPGDIMLRVNLDRPGRLVLAEYPAPGWNAVDERDGKHNQLPIVPTNLVMQSVHLEAGFHQVRFRYQPRGFRWGVYVSTISLAIAAVTVWRMDHRRLPD
ncbi:MAG: hypothetical protein O2931_16470, partial [Planctomycetota bacterium]|nr:hypothetical protein [Planctomycetota bacterium]